jgi:hypothetical protein
VPKKLKKRDLNLNGVLVVMSSTILYHRRNFFLQEIGENGIDGYRSQRGKPPTRRKQGNWSTKTVVIWTEYDDILGQFNGAVNLPGHTTRIYIAGVGSNDRQSVLTPGSHMDQAL